MPQYKNADLSEYLEEAEIYKPQPKQGYVPDAKTARRIGCKVIDNLKNLPDNCLGGATVEYDEERRLWRVHRWYIITQGGYVLIEQDSGKVVAAFLQK